MDVDTLRSEFTTFTYLNYGWKIKNNDLMAQWVMGNSKYTFRPSIIISNVGESINTFHAEDKSMIGNLIYHLGICEIMTYWKAFCSPVIEIKAGFLDDEQLAFWQKLLQNGMGQYFFENNIDYTANDFIKFKVSPQLKKEFPVYSPQTSDILVLLGGGKDSAAALEIIANNFKTDHIRTLGLNQRNYPAIENINSAAGNAQMIKITRTLDPLLFNLNKTGYLNGHTPFSAYLAFLSVLTAKLTGTKDIILSNEQSSNEGNTEYLGQKINHQYSKSSEFETDFRNYNRKYLTETNYFSLLRPLYELQILKMFSKMEKYHRLFISCNRAKDKWCGKCSKCASTFLGLYPFLNNDQITGIFGSNYFSDREMVDIYKTMVSGQSVKPFECVGTLEETRIALYLSYIKKGTDKKSPVMEFFAKEVKHIYDNWDKKAEELLSSWNKNNYLSGEYMVMLKNAYAGHSTNSELVT